MDCITDFIDDAFFSSSRFIRRNKIKSDSKRIFIFIYLLILFIYLFIIICSYRTQSTLSYSQFFIQKEDYEENMTFGFLIENNWTNKIIIEAFDSYNNPIFINNTCDENLNLLTNSDLNLTQNKSFKCFINYKFNKSNTTNHQIKIHLKKNNSFDFDEMQEKRIPFIIKFKEPEINHSLDNPFYFSNNLQELRYFYDIHNTTSYRKYAKIIEYNTYSIFYEKKLKSHYLEDYEDSSKSIEDFNETMIGSFRICLSKKKDIFERKYKTFLELMSSIGGFLNIFNMVFLIPLKLFVNSLDHLRLLNSITEKKNIDNKDKNIRKNFWKDDLVNKPKLSEIPNFDDEDKKIFFIVSMYKKILNIGLLYVVIASLTVIILLVFLIVAPREWRYYLIIILYILLIVFFVIIIFKIIKNLYKKGQLCFLIFFILNIIYIGSIIILWWLNEYSFKFLKDKIWCWLIPIAELIVIVFCIYNYYQKNLKEKLTEETSVEGQITSYPLSLVKYIDSNLNLDNLLEKEIINE